MPAAPADGMLVLHAISAISILFKSLPPQEVQVQRISTVYLMCRIPTSTIKQASVAHFTNCFSRARSVKWLYWSMVTPGLNPFQIRVLFFRNTHLCVINLPSFCDSVAFNNAALFTLFAAYQSLHTRARSLGNCSNFLAVAWCYSPLASKNVTGQSAHHTKFYTWNTKGFKFQVTCS